MRRPSRRYAVRAGCRGFTLVSAIFLLVALAALGAAIAVVSTTQQVGSALDIQGSRMYQAARAGIEWGVYKQRRPPTTSCWAASTSFSFATAPTLAGITVTVTCNKISDGNGGPDVYEIQSIACSQPSSGNCPNLSPGANYIERRVKVTL